jgi:hypothetical protein
MTIYVNENDPNEIKVFASDEFTETNLELERLNAERSAKLNREARLKETRDLLKFYNIQQQQQQQQPPPPPQQPPTTMTTTTPPKQQQSSGSNSSNNILRNLQMMRKIGGEY